MTLFSNLGASCREAICVLEEYTLLLEDGPCDPIEVVFLMEAIERGLNCLYEAWRDLQVALWRADSLWADVHCCLQKEQRKVQGAFNALYRVANPLTQGEFKAIYEEIEEETIPF